MQSASFKLSFNNKYFPVFLMIYFSILFMPRFKNGVEKIDFSFVLVIFLIILLISYVISLVKLTVTNETISLSIGSIRSLGWILLLSDITETLLVYAPLGAHKILLKNGSKNRQILLSMWRLDTSTFPFVEEKISFFKSRFNKKPEDFTLYQAIAYFQKNMREASSREAAEVIQNQLDLGARAGYATYAAVAFSAIAIVARVIDKSSSLESGIVTYFSGAFAVMFGIYILYYLRKCPNIPANILIGCLCAACSFWVLYSVSMASTYLMGKEIKLTYALTSQDESHQEWKNSETDSPTIKIYASPNKRKFTSSRAVKEVVLLKGFFNNYNISRNMTHEFVINPD